MAYKVTISFNKESNQWHAIGDYNNNHLAMQAGSIDVLIERSNLALSDLFETDKFEVEYTMKTEVDYGYL